MPAPAHPRSQGRTEAGRTVFDRPMSRVLVDLLGAPVGAVLFLGFAVLLLTGVVFPSNVDPLSSISWRVVGPLVFGFFGLLMAAGAPASLRRGLRRALLEVGPDGIWLPEMGRLAPRLAAVGDS